MAGGADFLVRAARQSHGLDAVITRCSNNYGPYQFPENRIHEELGWEPACSFEEGLKRTVDRYLAHRDWLDHVRSGAYQTYYRTTHGGR